MKTMLSIIGTIVLVTFMLFTFRQLDKEERAAQLGAQ